MSASTSMTKKIQTQGLSSSLSIDEETTMLMQKKQGIVTILGSDSETNTASASSLRRTLSADMSSKKWLSQNGSSPMKKIASSEELLHNKAIADSLSSSSEDDYEERKQLEAEAEAERERLEIWSSIQRNKKEEQEKSGQFDTWSSITSLKANDEISKSLPVTPYIHPLVKRSKSSLSEKSLGICTESLGSETGSDGMFSSSPSSDAEEDKEDELDQKQQQQQEEEEKVIEPAYGPEEEELHVPRYNYAAASTKKSPPRSFPPPLASLSRQHGPSLHMMSHRDNGRLVLEAVPVPSQKNFCVQRQDGRLVLTFANHHEEQPEEDADEVAEKKEKDHVEELLEEEFEEGDEEGKEHEGDDDDDETEEEEEVGETESDLRDDVETVIKKAPLLTSGITASVHRFSLMVNKPIVVNRNPKWSDKFNQMVKLEDVNVVEPSPVAKSLPPRPRVARLIPSTPDVASSSAAAAAAPFNFNAYEYYWQTKPTAKTAPVPNPLTHQQNNNSPLKNNSSKLIVSGDMNPISNHEQQQLLVLRGKNGDYLVHNLKSCKDSRRSLLFWGPNWIPTS